MIQAVILDGFSDYSLNPEGYEMTIEQVKALVRELVADGILYTSVAHNIDWAKYEDENLRALLVSILNDLKD